MRPLSEDIFKMRPFDSRIKGKHACVTSICPKKFTSNCRRQFFMLTPSDGPPSAMPALFTKPKRVPDFFFTSLTALAIDFESVTSRKSGRNPRIFIRSISSNDFLLRTPAHTVWPLAERSTAQARPIPVEAPEIKISMPLKCMAFLFQSTRGRL